MKKHEFYQQYAGTPVALRWKNFPIVANGKSPNLLALYKEMKRLDVEQYAVMRGQELVLDAAEKIFGIIRENET